MAGSKPKKPPNLKGSKTGYSSAEEALKEAYEEIVVESSKKGSLSVWDVLKGKNIITESLDKAIPKKK